MNCFFILFNVGCSLSLSETQISCFGIFQSIFNQSTLVNLFDYDFDKKSLMITNFNVTHISGTPTFYRMLISNGVIFNKIKQITLGGEGSDSTLINKLKEFYLLPFFF